MAEIPDFQWTAFYYPEQRAALLQLKTATWPEHTEDDEHDPVIRILDMMAVQGHQQASRLDLVAGELYWTTLQLRSSAVALAALIDYRLALAAPAAARMIADVSGSAMAGTVLVAPGSAFGTTDAPPIIFESAAGASTSEPSGAWPLALFDPDDAADPDASPSAPVLLAYPSGSLTVAALPDRAAIYFGHPDLLFDAVGVEAVTPVGGAGAARWEFYDPDWSALADEAEDLAPSVGLVVDSAVEASVHPQARGALVVVTCLRTGASETCRVTFGGQHKIVTVGSLGQTSISENPADYSVRVPWRPLPGVSDGSDSLRQSGAVRWTLPEDATRRWGRLAIEAGGEEYAAYWVRARWVTPPASDQTLEIAAPTAPRAMTWACAFEVLQGATVADRIGLADGSRDQAYPLPQGPLLAVGSVAVAGAVWTEVEDFLSSAATDAVYTRTEAADGSQVIRFGDGDAGAVPPDGAEIVATYRIGGGESGNVGAGTISRDRSGNTRIANLRNPRAASGWVPQEGTTPESLDALRVEAPASLRTLGRAVALADYEVLALRYRSPDGRALVERALAVEEGGGPKTVGVVCVGVGGRALTADELLAVGVYFNGETVGLQQIGGIVPANTRAVPSSFAGEVVDVTATVSVVRAYAAGAAERIETALRGRLSPTARRLVLVDGVWQESQDYQWDFGGEVSLAAVFGIIVTAQSGVTNVSTSFATITLGATALPIPGTISITLTEV